MVIWGEEGEKRQIHRACWSAKLMKDPISKPKPNQQP